MSTDEASLRRIAVVGGVPLIVHALAEGGPDVQAGVGTLLARMAALGPEMQRAIGLNGGVPVLVRLLLSPHTKVRTECTT